MNIFKKRGVAVLILIVAIVLALVIGQSQRAPYQPESSLTTQQWASEHADSYTFYVLDGAGLFSESTKNRLATQNAALDYQYGGILGVVTVSTLGGQDIADYADEICYDTDTFGSGDLVLFLDQESHNWYVNPGPDISYYLDDAIEIIFTQDLGERFWSNADAQILTLFEEVSDWYADSVPVSGKTAYDSGAGGSSVATLVAVLLFLLILVSLVISFIAAIARVSHGYAFFGPFWGPWWGGCYHRHPRWFGGHRHTPPPPRHNPWHGPGHGPGGPRPGGGARQGGPRPGSSPRPPHSSGSFGGGRSSGFGGGGSRGGFGGGGSRGGFGGGRR